MIPPVKRPGLLLVGAVVLLYFPFLGSPFSWDDRPALATSIFTHRLVNLPAAFTAGGAGQGWEDRFAYRPLAIASHFVDHLLWGHQPVGHRLPNLALHTGATVLLYHLLLRLLARGGRASDGAGGLAGHGAAFWGALLFGLHPAHSEVVYCAVYRHAAMGGLAMLATLWWHLDGGAARWKALGACAAGLLCSETVVIAPLAIWAIERIGDARHDGQAGGGRRALRAALPYAGLVGLYLAATVLFLPPAAWVLADPEASKLGNLLARIPRVLGSLTLHLQAAAFPWKLSVEYDPPAAAGWFDGRALFALWWVATSVGAAVWAAARLPVTAAGLFMATASLLLAQAWLPLAGRVDMVERHLYLVLVGASMAGAGILGRLQSRLVRPTHVAAALVPLTIIGAAFAVRTFSRGLDWRDPVRMYGENLSRYPEATQARNRLGVLHLSRREFEEARVQFEYAIARRPWDAAILLNLGNAHAGLKHFDVAERIYRGVLELDPGNAVAYRMLAALYDRLGRKDDSARTFRVYQRLSGQAAAPGSPPSP